MSNTILRLHCQPESEIKIMEFERVIDHKNGDYFITGDVKKGGYVIYDTLDIDIFRYYKSDGSPTDVTKCVTESLNPQFAEVITEEECLICDGKKYIEYPTKGFEASYGTGTTREDCPNKDCKSGSIETLTQKVLFNPKEYDEKLIHQGYMKGWGECEAENLRESLPKE